MAFRWLNTLRDLALLHAILTTLLWFLGEKKFQLLKWIDLFDKWVVAYIKPNTENCDREAENIGETNLK